MWITLSEILFFIILFWKHIFLEIFCLIHEKNVIHVVDTHESLVCEQNKFSKKICWTFFCVFFCSSFLVQKTRGRNVGLETRKANQFICKFDLFLSFFFFCLFVMETFCVWCYKVQNPLHLTIDIVTILTCPETTSPSLVSCCSLLSPVEASLTA